jgi:hypothetical protein
VIQRAPLVEMALELLEPENNAECRKQVVAVLEQVAVLKHYEQTLTAPFSKAGKASARRLAAALRRVERELKHVAVHELKAMISPEQIAAGIKACDEIAATPSYPPKRNADDKRWAAAAARALLQRYKQPVKTTKNSRFCRLAAVLYGTPDADFQHPCRKTSGFVFELASAEPGIK